MKLYKYVRADVVRRIIEQKTIRFSEFRSLNDPFDQPISPSLIRAEHGVHLGTQDDINELAQGPVWSNRAAILSLTRTNNNLLMWSHYADGHRGAVVCIDTNIAGLTDTTCNVIPAHLGSVVYTRQRDGTPYQRRLPSMDIQNAQGFIPEHYESMQRLFLMKKFEWAYEEEVRVVKLINWARDEGWSDNFLRTDENYGHLFELPCSSVTDIYFGCRSELPEEKWREEYCSGITLHRFEIMRDELVAKPID